ncbi:MAG: hypothetical protein WCG27_10635 [Pseudomonadota bacterium]
MFKFKIRPLFHPDWRWPLYAGIPFCFFLSAIGAFILFLSFFQPDLYLFLAGKIPPKVVMIPLGFILCLMGLLAIYIVAWFWKVSWVMQNTPAQPAQLTLKKDFSGFLEDFGPNTTLVFYSPHWDMQQAVDRKIPVMIFSGQDTPLVVVTPHGHLWVKGVK